MKQLLILLGFLAFTDATGVCGKKENPTAPVQKAVGEQAGASAGLLDYTTLFLHAAGNVLEKQVTKAMPKTDVALTFSKPHAGFHHAEACFMRCFFCSIFGTKQGMYQTLLTALDGGIFTITINRPDKLNALNKEVFNDLDAVLDEIENNSAIKAVAITGVGSKAFVAGADISEFNTLNGTAGMKLARRGQDVFFKIENNRKPIVAAVNGFALGGGCELAMACHFRVASESASFGQPEVNLGLIPGYGGTQRLVHLIGKGRALELLLTGNRIDAQTALHYGLVNYVVPQEELLPKTIALLQTISTKAPLAISKCITAVNAVFDHRVNGYDVELEAFGDCFETEDMKEGAAAFLEKRKPVFKGA